MGLGVLILLALCGGGYYVFRNGALLNAAEAKFVRRSDVGGQVVFDITPARPSLTFIVFRAGVSAIVFLLLVSFMGARSGSLAFIGFGIWLLVTFILFRPLLRSQIHRKPVTLTISAQALSNGQRHFPLTDIAQLNVRSSFDAQSAPVARAAIHTADGIPISGGTSISADVSRALHNRLAERSYILTVRSTNSSSEDVLSGGLTQKCAEALMNDVGNCTRNASPQ